MINCAITKRSNMWTSRIILAWILASTGIVFAHAQVLDEIIVTAQKREQGANDVGMSINTLSGEDLAAKRITDPQDLSRIIPSFTYTVSQFDFPTYTLRGVGFYDSSLTASPTVSVYVDQVPLPYPAMTRGAIFDLERLEVLKGPQGTLFGQNSTGGAINYIAAKPTDEFSAGITFNYGRFDTLETEAFASGPLGDRVKARIAIKTTQSDGWQKSETRPGDRLGEKDFTTGRLILEAEPTETFRLSFNLNGWIDRSDTQAPQLREVIPVVPTLPVPAGVQVLPSFSPRIADWTENGGFQRDNEFYQVSLRADWDLSSYVTMTSISAYQEYDQYAVIDGDGSPAVNLHTVPNGEIKSFSQELRFEGQLLDDRLNWLVGGNYQSDEGHDNQLILLEESTGAVTPFGSFASVINDANTDVTNWAGFANLEYSVNDILSLNAGIRSTRTKHVYDACSLDSGAGDLTAIFQAIQEFALGVPVTATAGDCVTLRDDPEAGSLFFTTGRYPDRLTEDNVSWRVGVNFQPFDNDTLFYANISQGFKSGSFPTVSAQLATQLSPAKQEKLLAYETGFKVPFADRKAQLNGAFFYYDYTDKQLRGRIQTFFGQLEKLVNIPESRIWGSEIQLRWKPIEGLTVSANTSYTNSEIGSNPDGSPYLAFPQRTHGPVPVTGESFPFAPEWTLSADTEYRWSLNANWEAFVGAAVAFQSRTKGGLESADPDKPEDVSAAATVTYNDPLLIIPTHTLVDLRAGVESFDGRWTASVWGKNVTNEYYLVNALKTQDTLVRYSGLPASYGLTVSFRF